MITFLMNFVRRILKSGKKNTVMLDTNILFSACFYPSLNTGKLFQILDKSFDIYIAEHAKTELFSVTRRKKPDREKVVKKFLEDISYTLVQTPENMENIPNIRDEKDKPILAAAIFSNVDYLITGDKDFLVLDIKKPKILTMQEFIEENS